MTVKELIETLQNFPQDMEVYTTGESVGGNFFECEAWKVREPHHRYVVWDKGVRRAYIAQRPCKETEGAYKCLIL